MSQGNQLDHCPCWNGTSFQVSLDIPSHGSHGMDNRNTLGSHGDGQNPWDFSGIFHEINFQKHSISIGAPQKSGFHGPQIRCWMGGIHWTPSDRHRVSRVRRSANACCAWKPS